MTPRRPAMVFPFEAPTVPRHRASCDRTPAVRTSDGRVIVLLQYEICFSQIFFQTVTSARVTNKSRWGIGISQMSNAAIVCRSRQKGKVPSYRCIRCGKIATEGHGFGPWLVWAMKVKNLRIEWRSDLLINRPVVKPRVHGQPLAAHHRI